MKLASVHAAVALVLVAVSTGHASHDGPLTVEVLGWDPATERIYIRQVGHDESGGERYCVYFHDLRSARPGEPRVVEASRGRWDTSPGDRAVRHTQLQRTLSSLQPLPRRDEGAESYARDTWVQRADSLRIGSGDLVPRFRLELSRFQEPKLDSIVVTTYFDPRVHIIRRYALPGCGGFLGVLSFTGDPWEGGYEVQRCALFGLPGSGLQVLDSPNGVLPWRQ